MVSPFNLELTHVTLERRACGKMETICWLTMAGLGSTSGTNSRDKGSPSNCGSVRTVSKGKQGWGEPEERIPLIQDDGVSPPWLEGRGEGH